MSGTKKETPTEESSFATLPHTEKEDSIGISLSDCNTAYLASQAQANAIKDIAKSMTTEEMRIMAREMPVEVLAEEVTRRLTEQSDYIARVKKLAKEI